MKIINDKTKIVLSFSLLVTIVVASYVVAAPAKERQPAPNWPQMKYTSSNLRDPFLSPLEIMQELTQASREPKSKPDLTHLKVQGIVWGSKVPQAIVNDTVVRQGDKIDSVEVLDIRKEGVYILYQGFQYILRPSFN